VPDVTEEHPILALPAPSAQTAEQVTETQAPAAGGVSWVPFAVYLLAWIVLATGTVLLLRESAIAGTVLWADRYAYTVYGGVALAILAPIISCVVWVVTRARRQPEQRQGLFVSALLMGASSSFLGASLWLLALYVLDLYRMGLLG